ncbi:MAG TPA: DUF4215 domain-containing protein, partial [Kofleriaceae bacterium]|nr:DUF4215 domain-containing protein [Kofleriaceae bacterium]
MRTRIQQAVMIGLLIAAVVGAGSCLSPLPHETCNEGWCPKGYLCRQADLVCIESGCGNDIIESDEECDDGNLDDADACLSTCQVNRCGDGAVVLSAEACDDGNQDDTDDCLSTCQVNRCGDGAVNRRAEACDDGNANNDDGCNNDCKVSLSTYIKASNTGKGDHFGLSVALSADGSTLAVGAFGEDSAASGIGGNQDDNSAERAGAVYVYTWSGTAWGQQAYIKASNTGEDDHFGVSVALSADGSTLAVGAFGEASAATGIGGNQDDNSAGGAGAVYVFERSGTTWSQQAYVKASNTGAGDCFGGRVALSADGATLAIGAIWESSAARGIGGNQDDNSAGGAGAVYVFERSGTTWSQQA